MFVPPGATYATASTLPFKTAIVGAASKTPVERSLGSVQLEEFVGAVVMNMILVGGTIICGGGCMITAAN